MRLATWNLNHRAARRTIREWVPAALAAQAPDLVVLTEYVIGPDHEYFLSALAAAGLPSVSVSHVVSRENQLLVASREPHTRRPLDVPDIHKSVAPNILEVSLDQSGVVVIGFRMPAYSGSEAPLKRVTWDWLLGQASSRLGLPALITGDFNTDFGDSHARCGDCMDALVASGWHCGTPADGVSWRHPRNGGGRRIDHLFVSPSMVVDSSDYSWEFDNLHDGVSGVVGSPDHAILTASMSVRHV